MASKAISSKIIIEVNPKGLHVVEDSGSDVKDVEINEQGLPGTAKSMSKAC